MACISVPYEPIQTGRKLRKFTLKTLAQSYRVRLVSPSKIHFVLFDNTKYYFHQLCVRNENSFEGINLLRFHKKKNLFKSRNVRCYWQANFVENYEQNDVNARCGGWRLFIHIFLRKQKQLLTFHKSYSTNSRESIHFLIIIFMFCWNINTFSKRCHGKLDRLCHTHTCSNIIFRDIDYLPTIIYRFWIGHNQQQDTKWSISIKYKPSIASAFFREK